MIYEKLNDSWHNASWTRVCVCSCSPRCVFTCHQESELLKTSSPLSLFWQDKRNKVQTASRCYSERRAVQEISLIYRFLILMSGSHLDWRSPSQGRELWRRMSRQSRGMKTPSNVSNVQWNTKGQTARRLKAVWGQRCLNIEALLPDGERQALQDTGGVWGVWWQLTLGRKETESLTVLITCQKLLWVMRV